MTMVSDGVWTAGTVIVLELTAGMFEPPVGAAVTVAVLLIEPVADAEMVPVIV